MSRPLPFTFMRWDVIFYLIRYSCIQLFITASLWIELSCLKLEHHQSCEIHTTATRNFTHISRCYNNYYYKCHGLECCHHTVAGALYKNLDLKLLHSSMQTSADHRSRRRHVSRMTDEKGETWSPSGMSKVRSGPESLVADCSMQRCSHR